MPSALQCYPPPASEETASVHVALANSPDPHSN